MTQNPNSIPLDDEDILDLTVIAEPGGESAPDGPPEPGSDFGADLDALLDSLTADGTAGGSGGRAPSPRPMAPAAPPPVAAPIADQTPADHVVDPNEELAMPEMADIDSLLAELGADLPAGQPAARAPAPAPEAPAPASAPAASAPMREFENILAQAQAAEAQKAAGEHAPADWPDQAEQPVRTDEPVPTDPAVDPVEAAMAASLTAASAPSPVPGAPAVADPFEDALAASAPGRAEAAGSDAETAGPDPEDSLDLNELDALLDDILATAPEMVSPSSRETVPVPAAVRGAPPAETIPVPDQALMNAVDSGLAERVQRMEDALLAIEGKDEWHRVQALEELVGKLEARENGLGQAEVASVVEARIVALLEPGSMLMRTIVDEVLAALSGTEGTQSNAFRETLEKMAAAAAAKVIREEIAAIMNDG